MRTFALLLWCSFTLTAYGKPTASVDPKLSGIQKVVVLLKEMSANTIKQGEDDRLAYDKYMCWCETTEAEKTAAIKAAEEKVQELEAFLEEAAAKEGELKTEIAALEEDIAADTEALATATAMRKEEHDAFAAEEADLKETLGLLSEAIAVLSKVQLVQTPEAHKQALLQVNDIIHHVSPRFQGIMQKDLYDLYGEFQGVDQQKERDLKKTFVTGSFLGEVFLPKHEAAALAQSKDLPWVKTEEQLGKEANPNDLAGAAAGAKSYNSRSGSILGILKTQGDKFAKNLAAAQKEELEALIAFQKLAAAKNAEIAAQTKQKEAKEAELADLLDKVAKSKEDMEATLNTLDADRKFLAATIEGCKSEDAEYAKRSKVRNEEIKALAETLVILTGDEARSLFDKTLNFMQLGATSHRSLEHIAMQEQARTKAMTKILTISKKTQKLDACQLGSSREA
jgi:chromosome segregation ATPase